jgi:surface protein
MDKMKGDDFRKDYDIEKDDIGHGSYGTVYKATKKDTKEVRAIKLIDIEKFKKDCEANGHYLTEKEINDFIKSIKGEITIMQKMEGENQQNKNTVKFYEYYYKENKEIAIVMELCDENFAKMIGTRRMNNKKFTFDEIRNILHQLNNCFKIMIKNKIAHRDLKPLNILVKYEGEKEKNNYILKICDYGEAKVLAKTKTLLSKVVGTYTFMAPEIMLKKENTKFDLKCDLWSLGIIIYYLYFGKYPFDNDYEIAIAHAIKEGLDLEFSNDVEFNDLIRKLLVKNPEERISWEQYFNHPFLNPNKILLTLKVTKENLNKKEKGENNGIYFLNNQNNEIKNLNNEDCELFINGEKTDFNFCFNPDREGEYEIKLVFKKKLTNCSNMFSTCQNIIRIDLSSFDSSQVTNMYYMFGKCFNLEEINLSNLDTSKVKDMSYLFNKCKTLKKIIFPDSFSTINVENMECMFNICSELNEINFPSSFVTRKVKNMEAMFKECNRLIKLDLRNFETNEVISMGFMFEDCTELKDLIIDMDKFKTDKVTHMNRMFSDCYNLEYVNIEKFNFSKVIFMNHMFENCEKLKEIDLSKLKLSNEQNVEINTYKIFDNLIDISVKANNDIIDKFKKEFKDIKYIRI